MSDVREWPKELGPGRYANAFEDDDIDISLPEEMDDQVLKEFGVKSADHRLLLRNAIVGLELLPAITNSVHCCIFER